MLIKIMADRYNYEAVINEVRNDWLEELLLFLELDIQLLNEMDQIHFVEYLIKNKVDIIEYPYLGALRVEQGGQVVGEWAQPVLKLKRDLERGGFYYEIEVECWSLIEENIEVQNT